MAQPIRVWIANLSLAAFAAWLIAFVLFPSSHTTFMRDLVVFAVVGIPALLFAVKFHKQRQSRYAAQAGAVFCCSILTLAFGPIAASGEIEAAIEYCDSLVHRLEKRRVKKGFYPLAFTYPNKPRPRHLSLHRDACRYRRKHHKAFTFSINRIDRDEKLVYRSWERGWFTESGEPWPMTN